MATSSATTREEATLAQQRLERFYCTVHGYLFPMEGLVLLLQEALLWKRPLASGVLYFIIHLVFVVGVRNSSLTLISVAGYILLWALMLDALWRAATKEGTVDFLSQFSSNNSRSVLSGRGKEVLFESVLINAYAPLRPNQLYSCETVSLKIAEWWMFADNLWLSLKHWSVHEPLAFATVLAVSGVLLSILGRCVPTIVISYLLMMFLIAMPYITYANLPSKAMQYLNVQYPHLIQGTTQLYQNLRTLVFAGGTSGAHNDDDPRLSLDQGMGEERTKKLLSKVFRKEMSLDEPQPQQMVGPGAHERAKPSFKTATGGSKATVGTSPMPMPRDDLLGGHYDNDHQQKLQHGDDSAGAGAGYYPQQQQHAVSHDEAEVGVEEVGTGSGIGIGSATSLDYSLSPGPGEFPSISALDQSLTLTSFPPGSMHEIDYHQHHHLPAIPEDSLDPYASYAAGTGARLQSSQSSYQQQQYHHHNLLQQQHTPRAGMMAESPLNPSPLVGTAYHAAPRLAPNPSAPALQTSNTTFPPSASTFHQHDRPQVQVPPSSANAADDRSSSSASAVDCGHCRDWANDLTSTPPPSYDDVIANDSEQQPSGNSTSGRPTAAQGSSSSDLQFSEDWYTIKR